nr:flavonoid O-methyltransferase 8 [Scutellaria baicalensis]
MALGSDIAFNQSKNELLDAQAHVWNHVFSFINSMSLKCAIQLGIPDAIHKHGKPMTLSELAGTIAINEDKSDGLYRLMRILTHNKFFDKVMIGGEDEEEEEAYCLTRASRLLLRDGPISMGPFVLAMLDPVTMDPWQNVSEWFHNEIYSPFETKHGRPLYEYNGIDQRFNLVYNEAMASDAGSVTSILTKECRHVFEGLTSMVDVAGGVGATAKNIADAFPGLKCTVLDLPHVVAGLEGSENLSFVAGDMFHSIPHAHAVFFKWILHNVKDEECVEILKKCKEAIAPFIGGKVIIVEMVVEEEKGDVAKTQLLFDLTMMVHVNEKERSEKEWANIFYAAGFTTYNITPILGFRSLIQLFP